jgi:hypothetical protein
MNRTNRDLAAAISDAEGRNFELKVEEWQNKQAMEDFARPLAQQFLVSPEAMSIRCRRWVCCLAKFQVSARLTAVHSIFLRRT